MSKFRSSSQVSVYNYPEHLNPFYEDEQHKRLRFWKIKTKNKSNDENKSNGGLRRGSFNLGSLRDLLPLKSFRMKKRSSALGINMTSESPPPLRRDIVGYNKEDEDRYASYDPHFRHTAQVDNFPRNAAYRSSLQNMSNSNNSNFLTFNRNNRYRNTIQNGSAAKNHERYVYSGSMTPQPKSRYLTDMTPRMTPGSSMNSVSTNPFEDDEDDVEFEEITTTKNSTNTLEIAKVDKVSKSPRKKKRRAPPPPPGQKEMLGAENVEVRTSERDGLEELSRMTREFENFVKYTNDDDDNVHEPRILLNGEVETTKMNECAAVVEENGKVFVEISIQTETDDGEEHKRTKRKSIDEDATTKVVKIEEIKEVQKPIPIPLEIKTTEIKASEVKIVELKAPQQQSATSQNSPPDVIKVVEIKALNDGEQKRDHVTITTSSSLPCQNENSAVEKSNKEVVEKPHIVINEVLNIDEHEQPPSIEVITTEVKQLLTEIRRFPEFQRLTPTPTPSREETPEFIPMTVREKFHVQLRIEEDENIENVNQKEPAKEKKEKEEEKEIKKEVPQSPKPIRDTTPIPLARTEVEEKLSSQGFRKVTKSEFLKLDVSNTNDDESAVELRRKDSTTTDVDELIIREGDEPPKAPERRRSVKEIIESINKQQKKLKINQPPTPKFERKFYYGEPQKFSYHEKPAVPSKENVLLKLKLQEEHERRMNELLDDLQDFSGRETIPLQKTQKFPLTDNNNNSFSNRRGSDEVNPIPKPRRAF